MSVPTFLFIQFSYCMKGNEYMRKDIREAVYIMKKNHEKLMAILLKPKHTLIQVIFLTTLVVAVLLVLLELEVQILTLLSIMQMVEQVVFQRLK